MDDKQLNREILTLLTDYSDLSRNWIEPLFSPYVSLFDRNKNVIFSIFFCANLELIKHEVKANQLKSIALKKSKIYLVLATDIYLGIIKNIKSQISMFNLNEQVGITHFRDFNVHGRIDRTHWEFVPISYYNTESDTIEKIRLSNDRYWEIIRDFKVIDNQSTLNNLRERFFDTESDFYWTLTEIFKPDFTAIFIGFQELENRPFDSQTFDKIKQILENKLYNSRKTK